MSIAALGAHCVLVSYSPINSLAPGKFEWHFRHVIVKQILVINDWGISCEIALAWKPQDLTDDKSTLVQVMAWCRQTTSHYLSQCWPRALWPYGVTRPQWVNDKRAVVGYQKHNTENDIFNIINACCEHFVSSIGYINVPMCFIVSFKW